MTQTVPLDGLIQIDTVCDIFLLVYMSYVHYMSERGSESMIAEFQEYVSFHLISWLYTNVNGIQFLWKEIPSFDTVSYSAQTKHLALCVKWNECSE